MSETPGWQGWEGMGGTVPPPGSASPAWSCTAEVLCVTDVSPMCDRCAATSGHEEAKGFQGWEQPGCGAQ